VEEEIENKDNEILEIREQIRLLLKKKYNNRLRQINLIVTDNTDKRYLKLIEEIT